MYVSPNIVQILHEERLREAQKNGHYRVIRDLAEPAPVEFENGLFATIKQWLRPERQEQRPETRDVRHAHA